MIGTEVWSRTRDAALLGDDGRLASERDVLSVSTDIWKRDGIIIALFSPNVFRRKVRTGVHRYVGIRTLPRYYLFGIRFKTFLTGTISLVLLLVGIF